MRVARSGRGARVRGVALALAVVAAPASAEIIDRVMAVVGVQVITLSDAQAAVRLGLVSSGEDADALAAAVERLVDRVLMLVEVNRYAPPEPAQEAIAARVAAVRAALPGDRFAAALATTGFSETRLREFLRDELRIEAYLDQRFAGAADRRRTLIAEWLDSLRRRAEITVLYTPKR